MPRFDGTGPESAGPLTGWGDGNCPDENVDNTTQNADTATRRRPLRRRRFFMRQRRPRMVGRGRGRRGRW